MQVTQNLINGSHTLVFASVLLGDAYMNQSTKAKH